MNFARTMSPIKYFMVREKTSELFENMDLYIRIKTTSLKKATFHSWADDKMSA